jgi:hypothetical protein
VWSDQFESDLFEQPEEGAEEERERDVTGTPTKREGSDDDDDDDDDGHVEDLE